MILLAVSAGWLQAAGAECTGPAAMTAMLHAHPTADNAIALGSWFASKKQFGCAVSTFRDALKSDPQSAQLHYLEGLALAGWGHTSEAISALQRSIHLDSSAIKPHLVIAELLDSAGRHTEAEEQWKLALKIDPASEIALEGLSTDLLESQNYTGVIRLLRSALLTEKLAVNLSQALVSTHYLDEANEVLTKALQTFPGSVPLTNAKIVVLFKQRRNEDAVDLAQQAVKLNPGNVDAEMQLFKVLVLTHHFDLAQPMGTRLLALRPHDADVLYLNGTVERSMHDYEKSRAHLEAAIAAEPDFYGSRYELGRTLSALEEWKAAKEQFEKAIALGESQPEAHYELAMALRALGDADGAKQELEQYKVLKKASEVHLLAGMKATQGDTDLKEGKLQDAIARYRESCEAEPDNGAYKFKLATALHQAGDIDGERAQLEAAVKLSPSLAGAQKQLGYLLARAGDAEGAVEHFRLAVRAAPEWPDAWVSLAAALGSEAKFAEAREAVATALRLEPDNALARELSDKLAHDSAKLQATP